MAPYDVQEVFQQKEIAKVLQKHFRKLRRYGCNFESEYCQNILQDVEEMKKWKISVQNFYRSCHLRMQCPSCKIQEKKENSSKQQKKRIWTSSIGTFQIKFAIISLKKYQQIMKQVYQTKNNTPIVLYKTKIWTMKCKKCKTYGKPFMYDQILEGFCLSFCKILESILNNRNDRQIRNNENNCSSFRQLIGHLPKLCEACREGVCRYRGKRRFKNKKTLN